MPTEAIVVVHEETAPTVPTICDQECAVRQREYQIDGAAGRAPRGQRVCQRPDPGGANRQGTKGNRPHPAPEPVSAHARSAATATSTMLQNHRSLMLVNSHQFTSASSAIQQAAARTATITSVVEVAGTSASPAHIAAGRMPDNKTTPTRISQRG